MEVHYFSGFSLAVVIFEAIGVVLMSFLQNLAPSYAWLVSDKMVFVILWNCLVCLLFVSHFREAFGASAEKAKHIKSIMLGATLVIWIIRTIDGFWFDMDFGSSGSCCIIALMALAVWLFFFNPDLPMLHISSNKSIGAKYAPLSLIGVAFIWSIFDDSLFFMGLITMIFSWKYLQSTEDTSVGFWSMFTIAKNFKFEQIPSEDDIDDAVYPLSRSISMTSLSSSPSPSEDSLLLACQPKIHSSNSTYSSSENSTPRSNQSSGSEDSSI